MNPTRLERLRGLLAPLQLCVVKFTDVLDQQSECAALRAELGRERAALQHSAWQVGQLKQQVPSSNVLADSMMRATGKLTDDDRDMLRRTAPRYLVNKAIHIIDVLEVEIRATCALRTEVERLSAELRAEVERLLADRKSEREDEHAWRVDARARLAAANELLERCQDELYRDGGCSLTRDISTFLAAQPAAPCPSLTGEHARANALLLCAHPIVARSDDQGLRAAIAHHLRQRPRGFEDSQPAEPGSPDWNDELSTRTTLRDRQPAAPGWVHGDRHPANAWSSLCPECQTAAPARTEPHECDWFACFNCRICGKRRDDE